MSKPFLVAALNKGLREGRGHVTLVSDEGSRDREAQRCATIAGIVRDSPDDFAIGADYLGVRSSMALQADGRRAPEVLLLCNLKTSALTEKQQKDIIARLRDRLDLTGELYADVPPGATRTSLPSPTLAQWLVLEGFDSQPPVRVQPPTPEAAGPSALRRWVVAISFVLLLVVGLVLALNFPVPSAKPTVPEPIDPVSPISKPTPTSVDDPERKKREQWNENLVAEVGRFESNKKSLKDLCFGLTSLANQLPRWPDENRNDACDLLLKHLREQTERLNRAFDSQLDATRTKLRVKVDANPLTDLRNSGDDLRDSASEVRDCRERINKLRAVSAPQPDPVDNEDPYRRKIKAMLLGLFDERLTSAVGGKAVDSMALAWFAWPEEFRQLCKELLGDREQVRVDRVTRNARDLLNDRRGIPIKVRALQFPDDRPIRELTVLFEPSSKGELVSNKSQVKTEFGGTFTVPLAQLGARGTLALSTQDKRTFSIDLDKIAQGLINGEGQLEGPVSSSGIVAPIVHLYLQNRMDSVVSKLGSLWHDLPPAAKKTMPPPPASIHQP